MSSDWYLLNNSYNQLSGFESDAIDDFAAEGFAEVLETSIATEVDIYSSDLLTSTKKNVVIQGNVQDTKLKSLSRLMLAEIGTCVAGMYVKYNGRFWLVVGLVDDNTMYEKAVLALCNYKLSWIDDNGAIVQRWASITSASQYNNGETSSKFYNVRSDQLMVLIPDDDKCLLLKTGERFIIDKRCRVYESEFDNSVTVNTSNDVIVYKITRIDSVLFDYQDSGHSEFMAYQDERQEDDGYYVVGGVGYWLCKRPTTNTNAQSNLSFIESDSDNVYLGLEPVSFVARFIDANGVEANVNAVWTIDSTFSDRLLITYSGNTLNISTNDPSLCNKLFIIRLNGDGYEEASKSVAIKDFI